MVLADDKDQQLITQNFCKFNKTYILNFLHFKRKIETRLKSCQVFIILESLMIFADGFNYDI